MCEKWEMLFQTKQPFLLCSTRLPRVYTRYFNNETPLYWQIDVRQLVNNMFCSFRRFLSASYDCPLYGNRCAVCYVFKSLPFDAVSGRQHVSVVDQRTAAIELVEIWQTNHPRVFVHARRFPAHDLRVDVRRSTTCFFFLHKSTY